MKKNADRFLTATYCDDIRQELGNKLSLMGCYQGELIVSRVPVALPKLCVYVSVWTPKEQPFKSLMIRIVQGDDVELARIELPETGLAEAAQIRDETATRKAVSTAIAFAPFVIEKSTSLRLVATTEEGEIIGPRLLIKVAPGQVPAVPPTAESAPPKARAAKKKPAKVRAASAASKRPR